MPGLIDTHTHTCQQLLRGRTFNEYPMIWSRILVPFESSLTPQNVAISAELSCLKMIESGTTAFADAGGVHMEEVAYIVNKSGMRAALTESAIDQGALIPSAMKRTPQKILQSTEDLYRHYHQTANQRIHIWFGIRQIMTASPALIEATAAKARELHTGLHAHLAEHRDGVSFCLQKYHRRPAEVLDGLGALRPNLLTAHNVMLSEKDIMLLAAHHVHIVHAPRNNLIYHGMPKTPYIKAAGLSIGIGSDGASESSLSLFDEILV
ncbi:MAG: amidohydrolase family protein, partial [Firmicutes bacterium]|nr:amidohydrolase family protein [Bacillota bacterium]